MRSSSRPFRFWVLLLGPAAAACTETGTGPEPDPVITVLRIAPDAALLEPGETLQPAATAWTADGSAVSDAPITWSTSDAAVATVDAAGRVTGVAPGSTEIVARIGSVEAIVAVAVPDAADETQACGTGGPAIAVIVQPDLATLVRARLSRFEADLCAAGYRVRELRSRFRRAGVVRAWLAREHDRTGGGLEGAILMGDVPHAYQWITLHSSNPSIPSTSEEAISFQYYADLDGTFRASPDYASPGGHAHSYDLHTGDVGWEIWIGRLPIHPDGPTATADAVNTYLDRNHAWRMGAPKPPRAFLQVSEHFAARTAEEHAALLAAMRAGIYAWEPFSTEPTAHLYFHSPPAGMDVHQGYDALERGVADFTVLDAHGSFRASGELTVEWAKTAPIATNFFWSNGCAVGDLDHADNFLTAVLYGPASQVLVAKGTTNDSGGMGNNADGFFGRNVATALDAGTSMGQAILTHVNVPLIEPWAGSREFHLATAVLLGDPTLRLRD